VHAGCTPLERRQQAPQCKTQRPASSASVEDTPTCPTWQGWQRYWLLPCLHNTTRAVEISCNNALSALVATVSLSFWSCLPPGLHSTSCDAAKPPHTHKPTATGGTYQPTSCPAPQHSMCPKHPHQTHPPTITTTTHPPTSTPLTPKRSAERQQATGPTMADACEVQGLPAIRHMTHGCLPRCRHPRVTHRGGWTGNSADGGQMQTAESTQALNPTTGHLHKSPPTATLTMN